MSDQATGGAKKGFDVGGQAVIEGVMMRSPRSYVVVCRLPDGRITLRESPWKSLWERLRVLRKPFLRGAVVLLEALQNGLKALSFSADQQAKAEAVAAGEEGDEAPVELSSAAIAGTIAFSVALGFLFFGALPHALAWAAGQGLGVDLKEGTSLAFHAIDGVIKASIFIGYLWAISRMKEIRRVFMYHGAEHKSIHAYEHGDELTVENARRYPKLHPRCGTSFLFLVILVSVVVFALVFPLVPVLVENRILNQVLYVLIKLPLMFPIAGLAYEVQRLSARWPDHPLVKVVIWPGLALQLITTVEPDDDMLEVALLSLRKVLWREEVGADHAVEESGLVQTFESFDEAAAAVALPVAA